jgi:outer membrane protein TolC
VSGAGKSFLGIAIVVSAILFSALLAGCFGVDGDVAKWEGEAWIPPHREEVEKKKQIEEYAHRDTDGPFFAGDLKLSDLLDIAFENSPITKKSWHAARIAAAQKGKAVSIFFPKVTISGVADRAEIGSPGMKSNATSFYPAIEIQCSVFQFGGHAESVEAARQLLYAANYQYNRDLQTLAHTVQKCYFAMDSAEGVVDASEKNLVDSNVAYDAAYVRNMSGLADINDFLRAKANKARAEFELENAKAKVEAARANLARAIGVKVSEFIKISRSKDPKSLHDFDIDVHKLIKKTMEARQDVMAFHSTIKAKKSAVAARRSKWLPELVIGYAGNSKHYRGSSGHFNNFDLSAALRWTVFDGFNNVYDVIEANDELRRKEEEFRELRLGIAAEVWEKYHAFRSAVRQLHAARNYEHAAEESFNATVISYNNGLSSFGDLMAAQNQTASARQQTVLSRNNLCMAIIDLAYAIGIDGANGPVNDNNKGNSNE